MFLGEIQITVILILPSKTRMCRKFFLGLTSSHDRHNIGVFLHKGGTLRLSPNPPILYRCGQGRYIIRYILKVLKKLRNV